MILKLTKFHKFKDMFLNFFIFPIHEIHYILVSKCNNMSFLYFMIKLFRGFTSCIKFFLYLYFFWLACFFFAVPVAFGSFQYTHVEDGARGGDDLDCIKDVNYDRLQGLRYKAFSSGLKDPDRYPTLLILLIIIEPMAWLTKWLLRSASTVRRLRRQSLGLA